MTTLTIDLSPFGQQSQSSLPDDAALLDRLGERVSRGDLIAATAPEDMPWWRFELIAPLPVARIALVGGAEREAGRATPLDVLAVGADGSVDLIAHLARPFSDDLATILAFSPPITAKAIVLSRRGKPGPLLVQAIGVDGDVLALPSLAQIAQDQWVIAMLKGKRAGSFVEFGSTDGVELSNTFALESMFGWSGVCVEPNPAYFEKLVTNRAALCLNNAAMAGPEREVEFVAAGVLGTVVDYVGSDHYTADRKRIVETEGVLKVRTMEPNAIMAAAGEGAPDYVSLDVEGAELDILRAIDLDRYDAALWTIEHNFVDDKREAVRATMAARGYERVIARWDDWYFSRDRIAARVGSAEHVDLVLKAFSERHGFEQG